MVEDEQMLVADSWLVEVRVRRGDDEALEVVPALSEELAGFIDHLTERTQPRLRLTIEHA